MPLKGGSKRTNPQIGKTKFRDLPYVDITVVKFQCNVKPLEIIQVSVHINILML